MLIPACGNKLQPTTWGSILSRISRSEGTTFRSARLVSNSIGARAWPSTPIALKLWTPFWRLASHRGRYGQRHRNSRGNIGHPNGRSDLRRANGAVPFNGRSYTDLLALQPGVVPATSLTSNTQQDVGVSALSPSGSLNPGTISINGQREFSNAFIVNGSDAEEDVNSGTAIIPNLDSIAEFRILTSNFDAEYGGIAAARSTCHQIRHEQISWRQYLSFSATRISTLAIIFLPSRGAFDQNQFGGTFGGPIRKNKVFFFADYQGTRLTQGVDTGQIPVPSLADRSGNVIRPRRFADRHGHRAELGQHCFHRSLDTPFPPGEPYYTPGCADSSQCVLPNAMIPMSAWSAPAKNLLQYIPQPNAAGNTFATAAYNQTLRDDKGAYRLDYNSHWGILSAYYFMDDYTLNNPYPVAQSGASVPGFNALYLGRAQMLALGDTKTTGIDGSQ